MGFARRLRRACGAVNDTAGLRRRGGEISAGAQWCGRFRKFPLGDGIPPNETAAVRLLTLHIEEPLPGRVLPRMAEEHGDDEAARRYRAVVVTTLRQLRGLGGVRLRILANPCDAAEALRFWLLPRLAERWRTEDGAFLADGWEIDFGGDHRQFRIEAWGEILCPFLSARWVHTALLGLERGTHRVTGPALGGGEYFHARAASAREPLETNLLPELPVIHADAHWREALDSPLGPALKRAWEEEG
jgi:glycosyltransferase A (GT-A) superfamily protein (DUF2064 family)